MLWVAIFLPHFALDCCQQGGPCAESPLGVCESGRLVAVNSSATQGGVQPGIAPATALALLPQIRLAERSGSRESAALTGLAHWALQFTPQVSLCHPSPGDTRAGLLLDVAASLLLFGGIMRLLHRMRTGLADTGMQARLACAPTASGAWMLARHRDGLHAEDPSQLAALLARLPVRLLDTACAHDAALQAIGVRTVGDLLQLPRAGVARRFGTALLDELDRALGARPDPRPLFQVPASFESRIELPAPIEDAERLLFAAKRLIVQLCGWLAGRYSGARRITLFAEHERQAPTPIAFGPDKPSRDPAQLAVLLTEALRRAHLRTATNSLRLACKDIHEHAAPCDTLFPGPLAASEQLGRLVERLKARLGSEQIQQLHQVAEHRPERAWRAAPADLPDEPAPQRKRSSAQAQARRSTGPAALPVAALSTSPRLRPLWLLEPPVALSERNNRPFWESPLSLLAGPERIESGWWDEALVMRDYFIAEDSSHRLLWIFRERHPGARQAWYLHGRFG